MLAPANGSYTKRGFDGSMLMLGAFWVQIGGMSATSPSDIVAYNNGSVTRMHAGSELRSQVGSVWLLHRGRGE